MLMTITSNLHPIDSISWIVFISLFREHLWPNQQIANNVNY